MWCLSSTFTLKTLVYRANMFKDMLHRNILSIRNKCNQIEISNKFKHEKSHLIYTITLLPKYFGNGISKRESSNTRPSRNIIISIKKIPIYFFFWCMGLFVDCMQFPWSIIISVQNLNVESINFDLDILLFILCYTRDYVAFWLVVITV